MLKHSQHLIHILFVVHTEGNHGIDLKSQIFCISFLDLEEVYKFVSRFAPTLSDRQNNEMNIKGEQRVIMQKLQSSNF